MPNVACPVCGTEYAGWSVRCPNCGTALEAAALDFDPTQLTDEEKVIYELGGWPLGVQAEVAQVMAESGIPHTWDDTDLVVHLDFEDRVDALLDDVEREAVASGLLEAPGEAVDGAEDGEVVYDLADWGELDRKRLDERLDVGGVPHVWEDTSLVVAAADDALVEQLLDEVEHPDALPAEPDDTAEAEEDEVRHELLSDLFDAADRLKNAPEDDRAIEELTAVLGEADADRPPYGFPAAVWRNAVELAGELGDLLVLAAGGDLDDADDDDEDDDDEEAGEAGEALDDDAVHPVEEAGHQGEEAGHQGEAAATGVEDAVAGDAVAEVAEVAGDVREADDAGEAEDAGEADVEAVLEGALDPEVAIGRKATALRDLLRPYV